MNALSVNTQVEDYLIRKVLDIYDDQIVYLADNLKSNQEVLLSEYFPSGMAKRNVDEDGSFQVYTHPTDSEQFSDLKLHFSDVYDKFKSFDTPNMLGVRNIFESCGTVYAVSNTSSEADKAKPLNDSTLKLDESEVISIVNDIVETMIVLEENQLAMALKLDDILLIDDGKVIFKNNSMIVGYSHEAMSKMIYELGCFIYLMVHGHVYQAGDVFKPDSRYSSLSALVNRMLDPQKNEKFENILELQMLLKPKKYVDEDFSKSDFFSVKPSGVSSVTDLMFIGITLVMVSYILVFNKEELKAQDMTLFHSIQFHLASYIGDDDAQYTLAEMYEKGYAVDVDEEEALEWYETSAKNGNLSAQMYLGYLYENGVMDEKNLEKAKYWYTKAFLQGNKDAGVRLKSLN